MLQKLENKGVTSYSKIVKWEYIVDILIIMAGVLFSALLDNSAIGLYLDSVNPDYLAVQILFPNDVNSAMTLPYIGFPVVGQLYHGVVTMLVQLLVIGITGGASLTKLRILNAMYTAAACIFMYLILKKLNVKRFIVMITELCLVTSASLFMIMKIQYYIKLPGTACTLLTILILLYGIGKEKEWRYVLVAGLVAGFAFYSYFIYLFYIPGYVYFLLKKYDRKKLIYNLLTFGFSFIVGCAGYFIGYFGFIISSLPWESSQQRLVMIAFCMMLLLISVIGLVLNWLNIWFKKISGKVLGAIDLLGIGSIVAYVVYLFMSYSAEIIDFFTNNLLALNVAGDEVSFGGRFVNIWGFVVAIFTNSVEKAVLGESVSKMPYMYLVLFLLAIVYIIFTIIFGKKNEKKKTEAMKISVIFIGTWLLVAIVFASRMGTQHFVSIYFGGFLVIGLVLQQLYERLSKVCNTKLITGIYTVLFVFLIGGNTLNVNALHQEVNESGCINLYSNQINKLAYDANDRYVRGEKEFYVFPEWGFMCGFSYLTNNRVLYSLDVNDYELINKYYNQGYRIKICYFDGGNLDFYVKCLEESGIKEYHTEEYVNSRGNTYVHLLVADAPAYSYAWNEGMYSDGWMNKEAKLITYNTTDEVKKIKIQYYVMPEIDGAELTITDEDGKCIEVLSLEQGVKTLELDLAKGEHIFKFCVSKYINPLRDGTGIDGRDLSVWVEKIAIE